MQQPVPVRCTHGFFSLFFPLLLDRVAGRPAAVVDRGQTGKISLAGMVLGDCWKGQCARGTDYGPSVGGAAGSAPANLLRSLPNRLVDSFGFFTFLFVSLLQSLSPACGGEWSHRGHVRSIQLATRDGTGREEPRGRAMRGALLSAVILAAVRGWTGTGRNALPSPRCRRTARPVATGRPPVSLVVMLTLP